MKVRQCQKCYRTILPNESRCLICNPNDYRGKIAAGGVIAFIFFACLAGLAGLVEYIGKPPKKELIQSPVIASSTPEVKPEQILFKDAKILEGKVVGVSDGDTITVLDADNQQYKIRLDGIDAPEAKQDFGDKSKQNLSDLIYNKTVRVLWKKTDKYNRIVGKVLLGDRDINLEQINYGLAWHYKKYESEQSDADRKLYADAEAKAKSVKLGLWSMANPTPPWDFRQGTSVNKEFADKIFGNKNSLIYHWAGCPGFAKIAEKNRIVFDTVEEAEEAGYRAAENCTTPKPETKEEADESETFTAEIYAAPIASPTPLEYTFQKVQPTPEYQNSYPTYEPTPDISVSRTATAFCADGTYSYSATRQGTCSGHGGVALWLDGSSSTNSDASPTYSSPSTPNLSNPNSTYVRGYTRKDGTYVAPYYRSKANSTKSDNWSTKGNINPYTRKRGSRKP